MEYILNPDTGRYRPEGITYGYLTLGYDGYYRTSDGIIVDKSKITFERSYITLCVIIFVIFGNLWILSILIKMNLKQLT